MTEKIIVMTTEEAWKHVLKAFHLDAGPPGAFRLEIDSVKANLLVHRDDRTLEAKSYTIPVDALTPLANLQPKGLISNLVIEGAFGELVKVSYTTYLDGQFAKPFMQFLGNLGEPQ